MNKKYIINIAFMCFLQFYCFAQKQDSLKTIKEMDKKLKWGFAILLLSIFIFSGIKKYVDDNNLDNYGKITKARIISKEQQIRNTVIYPEYQFVINNQKYEGSFSEKDFCKKLTKKDYEILSKIGVWIIYNPQNPNESKLLSYKEKQKLGLQKLKQNGIPSIYLGYINCDLTF